MGLFRGIAIFTFLSIILGTSTFALSFWNAIEMLYVFGFIVFVFLILASLVYRGLSEFANTDIVIIEADEIERGKNFANARSMPILPGQTKNTTVPDQSKKLPNMTDKTKSNLNMTDKTKINTKQYVPLVNRSTLKSQNAYRRVIR
jgi:hypothetical protein